MSAEQETTLRVEAAFESRLAQRLAEIDARGVEASPMNDVFVRLGLPVPDQTKGSSAKV